MVCRYDKGMLLVSCFIPHKMHPWLEAIIAYFNLNEAPESAHPATCRGQGV